MKQAFTLIELLVVVLIIGVLTSMALPGYEKAQRKALFAQVQLDMTYLMQAVDVYTMANGFGQASDINSVIDRPDWSCEYQGGSSQWWRCTGSKTGSYFISTASENLVDWSPNENKFVVKKWAHYALKKQIGQPWKWSNGYNQPQKDETTKMMCDWWGDRPKEAAIAALCE